MKSPYTGGKVILQREKRTLEFRKDSFKVVYHYYICCDTQEQFTDSEIDELNIGQVYNQYRAMYGIPFPDEIKSIREKYGLPATKMSEILGFGVNMYGKYEQGEIPNISNGRMIKSSEDPFSFEKYFEIAINQFTEKEVESIHKKIEHAKAVFTIEKSQYDCLSHVLGETARSLYTGFVTPSMDKAKQMILYFAENCKPYVTKMNKLLFYADFVNFGKTGYSISGISYRAIPHGPVPQRYYGLYEESSDLIEKEVVDNGEKIVPKKEDSFDAKMFSNTELETLKFIADKFKHTSTAKIIEISHKELAWVEKNENRELIPYDYAFQLNMI